MPLTELARYLPRAAHHNRYLRTVMRPHHRDDLEPRRHEHQAAVDSPAAAPQPGPRGD
jgi:putative (di)nucleoside polyphosphate hydrolase